jgi:hypothetical protein
MKHQRSSANKLDAPVSIMGRALAFSPLYRLGTKSYILNDSPPPKSSSIKRERDLITSARQY